MNNVVDKFLLEGDKFMLEMYLRQQEFTYIPSGLFTKTNKNTKIHRNNKLDKV